MLFILLLKLFQPCPLGGFSDWFLCPFNMPPSFCILSASLLSDTASIPKALGMFFIFSDLVLNEPFFPGFFYWRMVFRKQDLGTGCACCCWDVDAGWLGLRTSQEGPWLRGEYKSNVSQEEVRTEFIEDLERADIDRASGRLRKERRLSSIFAWSLGFLLGTVVWCTCLLKHPGPKTSVQVFSIGHLRPGARCLDELVVLVLPGHSLDAISHAGRLQRNH